MIPKTQSFQTSDGKIWETIQLAQRHELICLMDETLDNKDEMLKRVKEAIADHLVISQDRVVDILTTKASSKPKARSINGGTKKRTPKPSTVTPT